MSQEELKTEQQELKAENESMWMAEPQVERSGSVFRLSGLIAALVVFVVLFGYAIHERNLSQQLSAENQQNATALKDTRGQIDSLNAKLDGLIQAQTQPAVEKAHATHVGAVRHAKPDPRWKKLQTQLDAQGRAIDETRQGLASTQQDLTSAKTELSGSIARTHDELVTLQKKGERNYYEFDLDKSKQFSHEGPVGMSLRKANTKHQYADLELLVDDREVSKKHFKLYEPAMFYPDDEHQPVELVINSITKNHIRGYISTAKYRASELAATTGTLAPQAIAANAGASSTTAPELRHR